MKRKFYNKSWNIWIILLVFCIFLSVTFVGGKYNSAPSISEDDEIIKVVESFWNFTEEGEFEKAHALTTKTFKGITVEVENQEPMERWLHKLGIKHILIEMHEKVSPEKCVVRIKVRNGERKYYLFQDLVKDEEGRWKIISISN